VTCPSRFASLKQWKFRLRSRLHSTLCVAETVDIQILAAQLAARRRRVLDTGMTPFSFLLRQGCVWQAGFSMLIQPLPSLRASPEVLSHVIVKTKRVQNFRLILS
jgi:hypothetical protein